MALLALAPCTPAAGTATSNTTQLLAHRSIYLNVIRILFIFMSLMQIQVIISDSVTEMFI